MKKILLFVVVVIIVVLALGSCNKVANVDRPANCKWFQTTRRCTLLNLKNETGSSWKDFVQYSVGGSGQVDPSRDFSDLTAVDHDSRLIVDNEKLDPRACFPNIDDAGWQAMTDWANQWGADSPTRIEWQVSESRCSWVLPGNITDNVTEQDYKDVLKILASYGYTSTWFVGGDEGQEFGKVTYQEIMASDPTFNRVHIYGPQLAEMPTKD